jgi:TAF6 C-terminal HEAT repeat domain
MILTSILVIDVIQKNPKMQILVPFIIDHINKNYDKVVINGALKKNLYITIIDALFKNVKVNLEFHKHILIKILDHFLTSPKISLNVNKNELILRENAAKLLSKIILMNDDLKYINLKPHLFDLLCKKLVMMVDDFNEKNFGIIHGIFKVIFIFILKIADF